MSAFCVTELEMEGDDCSFPDSSGDHSQRGSVASSATFSRGVCHKYKHNYCSVMAEFVLDDIPFRILFLCLCSSRCTRLSVRRECRSPHIRRPWDSDRTGAGTKCSWGSPYTWFCSGSVCLLALFSTAWWEHTIIMIICWPLRMLHTGPSIWSDQFSRVLMWLPM